MNTIVDRAVHLGYRGKWFSQTEIKPGILPVKEGVPKYAPSDARRNSFKEMYERGIDGNPEPFREAAACGSKAYAGGRGVGKASSHRHNQPGSGVICQVEMRSRTSGEVKAVKSDVSDLYRHAHMWGHQSDKAIGPMVELFGKKR